MLSELLNFKKGDILSLVGSGGKTTTMYRLGKELSGSKVLLTTSTKIGKVEINDVITLEKISEINKIKILNKNYLTGNTVENNKFTGITNEQLTEVKEKFDYIVIEADGSKRLPLKGWRDKEPVILNSSNKTLGIIPFDLYGKKLSEIEIFQRDIFMEIVGESKTYFDSECLFKIINSEKGIFKNTKSKRYILLNKCDDDDLKNKALDFINKSILENSFQDKVKFIYGSSKKGEYYAD